MITVDLDKLAEAVAERLEPAQTWLTVNEAAEHLRLSAKQVRRLAGDEFPVYRPEGGRMLFNRQELDSWVTSHRR